ncbi:hypothetical protein ABT404_18905 [Streptomyces hyaluromycini]|uniref:Uncharacterized protein n=1 Tax=Streptomyces hyaluromycini TaxID=1377993 RepID=A0ABV1WXM5_9ACTN
MGSGGTRISSGVGPFSASSSLGGGRRRTTTSRTTGSRAVAPSAGQLERARRQAERAQQEAERDAAIAQLEELRQQTTGVHLQSFAPARPPVVPGPQQLSLAWALAEAQIHHFAGLGVFARAERAAAKRSAGEDAPAYLAAEEARLHAVHTELTAEAGQWWQALVANDEETVCEAVNYAFSDNAPAGCAVGVDGAVLSVVMRQQDIDSLPAQMPGLTPSGRPTLKTLSKRDRTMWWLTTMASNIVATLKEAFAVAPGITAIDLAVLTRLPDTQRLGFVAYAAGRARPSKPARGGRRPTRCGSSTSARTSPARSPLPRPGTCPAPSSPWTPVGCPACKACSTTPRTTPDPTRRPWPTSMETCAPTSPPRTQLP